ncbi:MAG: NAD(P)/FAD-dependent oxidoreductase [Algicola sp.]|nr:NAD(P)/FAD-dependent oxidoreductase [Algicola sp.]
MNTTTPIFDVIIVGGGLAGLSSAIHLSTKALHVLVIEKNSYPRHKVCGEYISNEVLPYLNYLGVDVFQLGAKHINEFQLSSTTGKLLSTRLPLGGFGISRYCLDAAMANHAIESGANLLEGVVENITYENDLFSVKTKDQGVFQAKIVIGAYGKRAQLDRQLQRKFIASKSPYLAVKTHVEGDFSENVVALHNFRGGYCGASKVENDHINLCYITNFRAFKKHKNIQEFQEHVLYKNHHLETLFNNTNPVFEQPLTISQISFEAKKPIENHILMCGDTAALIHPLCGNGMSMAMRSAQIASELILKYYRDKDFTRNKLETQYTKAWTANFKSRLKTGQLIARVFNAPKASEAALKGLKWFPSLLPYIIKQTHGELMQVP